MSEYSHVVGFITSSASTTADIAKATVNNEEQQEAPSLARSASVREPSKTQKPTAAVGDLARKHGTVDQDAPDSHPKPNKDNKRRTVQVEYVAPKTQTQRGEPSTSAAPSGSSRTRARAGSGGPVEVQQPTTRRTVSTEKPLPQDPPSGRDAQYTTQGARSSSSQRQQGMPPPARPGRGPPRSVSDTTQMSHLAGPPVSMARPNTGGSMTSTGSRSGAMQLPTRGSYSQPVAPTVAGTNATGRMSQPKNQKNYNISAPVMQDVEEIGRPSTQLPPKFARIAGADVPPSAESKGHKRSNTIGGFFSRTNSVFGGKSTRKDSSADQESRGPQEKPKKSYPPVSMTGAVAQREGDTPRQSMDSRRSISFGFGKKRSGSISGSQTTLQDKPRRFSFLPASISLKAIGIGKDPPSDQYDSRPDSRGNYLEPPLTAQTSGSRNVTGAAPTTDGSYDRSRDSPMQDRRGTSTGSPSQHQRYASYNQVADPRSGAPPQFLPPMNFRQGESTLTTESESSLNDAVLNRRGIGAYPPGFNDYDSDRRQTNNSRGGNGRGVLQKNNRKFTEAYEQEAGNGYGPTHVDHAGSSGAARKVMDFFRRRGRDRGGER